MGGEPSCDSAGVIVLVIGSYAGIKVRHLGILLGTSDSCTRSFRRSASTLREPPVVSSAVAWFVLGRATTVILTGTSSTSTVVHVLHP
jgi:hypothetical protein